MLELFLQQMAQVSRAHAIAVLVLITVLTSAAGADVVRLLEDPGEAAQARVDLIQQASHEINALYFLARNDQVTMTALALLREAQRTGVSSRLLVDANFHHIPKAVLAHLRDEGVEVREYHPLSLRHPSWIFKRLHEKLVVVDGQRYITGGRNLAEAYFGLAEENYVDRDLYVDGASARDADSHFDHLWTSGEVRALRAHASDKEKRQARARLDLMLETLRCGGGFVTLDTGRDWSEHQRSVDNVRFIHDALGNSKGARVGTQLAQIFETAKHSIVIESPYLVPSRSMLDLLERKSSEGVEVLIVTNSLRSTDGLLPFAGYLKYRRRLVRNGIDIREFKGPDTLHAKSAVIDGRIIVVGSYNFDRRSQNLDVEGLCVAEDAELARQLLAAIGVHAQHAWKVESHGRPPGEQRMPASVSFGLRAARLLLPFYEGQL